MYIFFIASFFALFLNGCASTAPDTKHIIAINKHGNPADPNDYQTVLSEEEYQKHLNAVLTTDKNKIIIYIHGGLNTPQSTNTRISQLFKLIDADGYHPIFISWRSGFVTTYLDHLFTQRQGEDWPIAGKFTFPFILMADLGRGFARTPINWWYQTNNYLKGITFDPCEFSKLKPNEINAVNINCNYIRPKMHKFGEITRLTEAYDNRSWLEKSWANVAGGVKLIPGLLAVPFADSLATGAWDVMKQRTEVMFTKAKPWGAKGYKYIDGYTNLREGALTKFLKRLEVEAKNKEIILIGHSMGSIIANKILVQHPNLHFSRIVYMAAACSIRDFQNSVIPYLQNPKHQTTKFYNYTLHPVAENLESYDFKIGSYAGVLGVGAGSLLNLIDNFFENPVFENNRTLGKWVNVMNGINFFNIDNIQPRIFLRTMKLDSFHPITHGGFDDPEFSKPPRRGFWTEEFGKEAQVE